MQVPQPGRLPAADPVLDPGVGAVPHFEVGELPADGVGEEGGEPVPVEIGEPQLRAGVRPFVGVQVIPRLAGLAFK